MLNKMMELGAKGYTVEISNTTGHPMKHVCWMITLEKEGLGMSQIIDLEMPLNGDSREDVVIHMLDFMERCFEEKLKNAN